MDALPLFEGMLDSKARRPATSAPTLLPIVLLAHLVLLGSFVVRHYLRIPPIDEPPLRFAFAQLATPPPPPGPAMPAPATPTPPEPAVKPASSAPEPEVPIPDLLLEPVKTPDNIDLTGLPEISDAELAARAGHGGHSQGVQGGVPGGVPGGLGLGSRPPAATPVRLDPGVAPRRIHYVAPVYPRLAQEAGIAGVVRLEAVIHRDGSVGDIHVLQDLPLGCTEAAIEALRQWRYEPWRQNGVAVDAILLVEVQFQLQ